MTPTAMTSRPDPAKAIAEWPLSDTERKVAMAYGAADDATARSAKRQTFVISPDGKTRAGT